MWKTTPSGKAEAGSKNSLVVAGDELEQRTQADTTRSTNPPASL